MDTKQLTTSQDIDLWIKELKAAGWTEWRRPTIWQDPDGRLFRGPYRAWCLMRQQQEYIHHKDGNPRNNLVDNLEIRRGDSIEK